MEKEKISSLAADVTLIFSQYILKAKHWNSVSKDRNK
jgi:hypothetical protein